MSSARIIKYSYSDPDDLFTNHKATVHRQSPLTKSSADKSEDLIDNDASIIDDDIVDLSDLELE